MTARHEFRTDNASDALASVTASAAEALAGMEASANARRDALPLMLAAAKGHCLADPIADRFTTWEAWVTAMQVGSALFASAVATEGRSRAASASTAR
ncbi:hypothetical protein [Streptomyces sp. NBC_01294]|uniref:hypothetical protein n=1 Tax=Streptomyces sp. NBC_01294 TaxID=2903815 RepID=UPI002DDC18CE|nr:hypothetical protein [Streptomyces sp. NBC_01294]WRZ57927.1 hypothetical protein OG534_16330 [Streptomyces sp. NBC_01294]